VAYAAAIFLGVTFLWLAKVLGVFTKPLEVSAASMDAYRVLIDPSLHDDAKEAAMRKHAKTLGWLFVVITGGSIIALGLPFGIIWLMSVAGLVSLHAVLDALISWPMLIGCTLLFVAKVLYDWVRPHGVR
jgi:hypothetical protein